MCIIKKVFYYEETKLPVIKYKDEIWVKANTVANILRYKNTKKSIQDHVEPEDKRRLSELAPKSKGNEALPLERNEKNTSYINEFGLYSLILCSKLESARVFKRRVTKEVLPAIRKTGRYSYDDMNHKYNDSRTFKIENELDLHIKVVSFLKKKCPNSIFTATLGENQDTSKEENRLSQKRLPSWLSRSTIFINSTLDLQLSSKIQKELVFSHTISLRCCDIMKTMASRLSSVTTMTI